jgi:hypothetical protein
LAVAISCTTHAGLIAQAKESAAGTSGAVKTHYKDDREAQARLNGELAKLKDARPLGAIDAEIAEKKIDRYYGYSDSCTNATYEKSRDLCKEIKKLEGERAVAVKAEGLGSELQKVEARLRETNMETVIKSNDPQAELFASALGIRAEQFRFLFAAVLAVATELLSSLLLPRLADHFRKPQETPAQAPKAPEEIVKEWAAEMLIRAPGKKVPLKAAYAVMRAYAEARGEAAPEYNVFRRAMGPLRKVDGEMCYDGVTLRNSHT